MRSGDHGSWLSYLGAGIRSSFSANTMSTITVELIITVKPNSLLPMQKRPMDSSHHRCQIFTPTVPLRTKQYRPGKATGHLTHPRRSRKRQKRIQVAKPTTRQGGERHRKRNKKGAPGGAETLQASVTLVSKALSLPNVSTSNNSDDSDRSKDAVTLRPRYNSLNQTSFL